MKTFHLTLQLAASTVLVTLATAIAGTPQRIISLVPSVTEELFELGLGDRIVGDTVFCTYPENAGKKEKVGTFLNPNMEKILRLKPDVVFATKEGHSREMVERIRSLGINLFVFEPCRSFTDVSEQFILLGKTTGAGENARLIVRKAASRVESVKRSASGRRGRRKPLVFWQVGASPIITSGAETFADEMIRFAGGINLAGQSRIRYPRYSREEVVRRNPDIIVIIEMGIETRSEADSWKRYTGMKAVKNGKIYIIDGHGVLSPTPSSYAVALEKIYNLFHER